MVISTTLYRENSQIFKNIFMEVKYTDFEYNYTFKTVYHLHIFKEFKYSMCNICDNSILN